MIKAIFFDFDGTLVDFVAADINSLEWLHSQMHTPVGFDEFLATAVDEIMAFHRLVDQKAIDPLLMHHYRLQNSCRRLGIPWQDAYVAGYQNKLLEQTIPFAGVVDMLAMLRRRVKLGLITNAYDAQEQRARIRRCGLAEHFDVIVVAGELGIYKPDRAIFWHALSLCDEKPKVAIFVGDSIKHDMVGAKSAGMGTVLLSKQPEIYHATADYVVSSIDDLRQLCEKLI